MDLALGLEIVYLITRFTIAAALVVIVGLCNPKTGAVEAIHISVYFVLVNCFL